MNFILEPEKALMEMKRVTAQEGTVAVYVWDYTGKMEFLRYFWDASVELAPEATILDEGNRFPDSNALGLESILRCAVLCKVETTPIDIDTIFKNFDDFWQPVLGGQGPAPTYMLSLDEVKRNKLRDVLYDRLPIQPDGSIPLVARAWAAKSEI